MRIRRLWTDQWALVPEVLREVVLRVCTQEQHAVPAPGRVRLEICDADLTFLSAVELSGPESLQKIQQQAAELGYRSLRLVGATPGESCRFLLVRNRDAARALRQRS
jgi:hypothetical protein